MADANCADYLAPVGNMSAKEESLLHSLDQATRDIGFNRSANVTESMSFE